MYRGRNSVLQCYRHQNKGTCSMVTVLGAVIAIVFLAYLSFGNNSKVEPTLRFLSILHRHGERNPTFTYPLDPYKNESFWPEGKGELMKKGKITLFEAGQMLRKQFDGFIPAKYKASDIVILSSHIDRCIMSAQTLLAGLYPPVDDQIWNSNLLWQPIPVHSLPRSQDNMLIGTKECPRLEKEKQHVIDTFVKKHLDENQELIEYVIKNTGLDVKSILDLDFLYDNLLIVTEAGLKLPDWAQSIFPEKLKPSAMVSLTAFSQTPTMRKFFSGVLISDMISNMKKKRNSKDTFSRLLNVYSAHDITLINFWRSLGVIQEVPKSDYGATFVLELHELGNKYRVKVLYKNYGRDNEWTVLSIKGCEKDQNTYEDNMCDLDVLATALEPVLVKDFDKECQI